MFKDNMQLIIRIGWVGYDSLCWGITACDGPTDKYNFGDKKFYGYAARGTSGPQDVQLF